MSSPIIEAFWIDDQNEEKFWEHGLSALQVVQILERPHRIKRNRNARRATHLIVGTDAQGRCIVAPVEPTFEPGVWRPITAWPCKPSEWGWLP